jgi:AraC-like DNA-binding protein
VPLEARGLARVDGDATGYYVASRNFAFGVTSHGVVVTVAWGVFDAAEARKLGEAWTATFTGPPRPTLIDVTHLLASDHDAFTTLRDVLEHRREERARVVQRQAIVANADYGAVFLRGYLAMFPPPYELRDFSSRDDALAWLQHSCCASEIAELDGSRSDELQRLRAWLETTDLASATIEVAAAAIGMTERTLQRRLEEVDATFQSELARVQIARAQRLMRETDRKLSDIALEVGCATPSVFSELFRKITGETPSQWRRRTS